MAPWYGISTNGVAFCDVAFASIRPAGDAAFKVEMPAVGIKRLVIASMTLSYDDA